MTRHRVLIYVQFLLGVGHLYRACHVARAMRDAGLEVILVSGGMPVPGLDLSGITLHQLTPIKCRDGNFSDLVNADGVALDDAFKASRREEVIAIFEQCRPSALMIEAFPFGRRQMRFEILPLLERAHAASWAPLIISSVRDILQVSEKPGRAKETTDIIRAHFDGVLVHADPEFVRLEETFPKAAEIADRIHYTGMVAGPSLPGLVTQGNMAGEVLVSAGGGGARSEELLAAAIAAKPLSGARSLPWRLLTGPNLVAKSREQLAELITDDVILEPNRPDFPELLAGCSVSISQAGYNTATDLMQCGCRAVLVPYATGGQSEQPLRARLMRDKGLAKLVEEDHLGPQSLAAAIDSALASPAPGPARVDLMGAEKSAQLVLEWLN